MCIRDSGSDVVLPVDDVRRANDLAEPVDHGNAAPAQTRRERTADMRRKHDRAMPSRVQPARDLIDDDLGAGPKGKSDVRDQNRETP